MDQSVRLVNSLAVAIRNLSQKRKTTRMEGISQNLCLGCISRSWEGGHIRGGLNPECQERRRCFPPQASGEGNENLNFLSFGSRSIWRFFFLCNFDYIISSPPDSSKIIPWILCMWLYLFSGIGQVLLTKPNPGSAGGMTQNFPV